VGAPSFAYFAKGGNSKRRARVGVIPNARAFTTAKEFCVPRTDRDGEAQQVRFQSLSETCGLRTLGCREAPSSPVTAIRSVALVTALPSI